MATAIDIGIKALTIEDFTDVNTYILKDNPANESGKITSIDIYCAHDVTGLKVAIFEKVDANNFTARDSQLIGDKAEGKHEGLSVDLDVVAGDYIGYYTESGNIKGQDSGAGGLWYLAGDQTECVNAAFSFIDTYAAYLYGEGATLAVGRSRGYVIG